MIKPIRKSIEIDAPPSAVWSVFTDNERSKAWLTEFMPGTYARGTWQEGELVDWIDPDGNGMVARVAAAEPGRILDTVMAGMVVNFEHDFDSPEARMVDGGHETYRFEERDGKTRVDVETAMTEEYWDHMSAAWDKALATVKAMAEGKQ